MHHCPGSFVLDSCNPIVRANGSGRIDKGTENGDKGPGGCQPLPDNTFRKRTIQRIEEEKKETIHGMKRMEAWIVRTAFWMLGQFGDC